MVYTWVTFVYFFVFVFLCALFTLVCKFLHISRAHCHAPSDGLIFVSIGERKEVWDHSTGLPLDPEMVQKNTTETKGFRLTFLVSPSLRHLKNVANGPATTTFRLSGWTSTMVTKVPPRLRSWLVVMETPYRSSNDPNDWNSRFTETPPLDSFRQQMGLAMCGPKPEPRAHFHASIQRLIFAGCWRSL